jgi:hypothetical protein
MKMKKTERCARSRGSYSEKNERIRSIAHSRSLSSEDLSLDTIASSSDVFANFNPVKPNKFLEDALTKSDLQSVYAGLQHGMMPDTNFKVHGRTLSDLLNNPIPDTTPHQERQMFLHLKAFTIMNSIGECSGYPKSKEDFDLILSSSIQKNSGLHMRFNDSETRDISHIINDQFYTNSGMIYLLSADIMTKINTTKSTAEVMYDIYKLHSNGANISALCNSPSFRGSKIPGTYLTYGDTLDYISRVQKVTTYASYEDMELVGSSASYFYI